MIRKVFRKEHKSFDGLARLIKQRSSLWFHTLVIKNRNAQRFLGVEWGPRIITSRSAQLILAIK